MTEGDIQLSLYHYCYARGHEYMTPNVYLYDWESDFLSLTKKGSVFEFEIKTSRADFMADAGKTVKHQGLESGARDLTDRERNWVADSWIGKRIREKMDASGRIVVKRPNFFVYVVPENLVAAEEVPKYAGLLYIDEQKPLPYRVKIPAPKTALRLHKEPISDVKRNALIESHYWKYWKLRLAIERNEDESDFHLAAVGNMDRPGPENH